MVTYLTLGDGDFTYSLDLAKYLSKILLPSCTATQDPHVDVESPYCNEDNNSHDYNIFHSSRTSTKLIATGMDSAKELARKYKDSPFILQQIHKQQERTPELSVVVCHGVNAIIQEDENHFSMVDDWLGSGADHVMFHHPHLGTEDAALHGRFLAHLFYSATTRWMKPDGGLFHLTLVQGQFERWECEAAAQRHGLVLLCKKSFCPPPVDESMYHCRRHQSGRSFASRRPKSESITFSFGRVTFMGEYPYTCLPWQIHDDRDLSQNSITTTETTLKDNSKTYPIQCPFCAKGFREERSCKSHVQNKHLATGKNLLTVKSGLAASSISLFECNDCIDEFGEKRTFQTDEAFQAHRLAKHSGRHTYIAPDWSVAKNFATVVNNMREQSSREMVSPKITDRTSPIETCQICGISLQGCSLSDHFLAFTPSTICSSFQCCFCNKSFREDRARLQHENYCSPSKGELIGHPLIL